MGPKAEDKRYYVMKIRLITDCKREGRNKNCVEIFVVYTEPLNIFIPLFYLFTANFNDTVGSSEHIPSHGTMFSE